MGATEYQKTHRKEINEWRRTYYKEHPEVLRRAKKRHYEKYKERYVQKAREDYEKRKRSPDFKAKAAARLRKWVAANREHCRQWARRWHLKKVYGLTLEQYDSMLERQHGGCAICGTRKFGKRGYPVIDHCHTEQHVRGLLCSPCNLLLGRIEASPGWLQKAEQYVRSSW